jgi:hypothetical protein
VHFDLNVTPYEMALNGILQGLSIGMVFVPLSAMAFSDLELKYRPGALGVFHPLRNVGLSLFISIGVAAVIRPASVHTARVFKLDKATNSPPSSWRLILAAYFLCNEVCPELPWLKITQMHCRKLSNSLLNEAEILFYVSEIQRKNLTSF